METISFTSACRTCLKSDSFRKVLIDHNDGFKNYSMQTEFLATTHLQSIRPENANLCKFCGSRNEQIEEVWLNDEPLFNLEYLYRKFGGSAYSGVFELSLRKENGNVYCESNAHQILNRQFLKVALWEILYALGADNESQFQSIDGKGNFYVCVAGELTDDGDELVYVHRLTFAGFLKETILNCIIQIAKDRKIDILNKTEPKPKSTLAEFFNDIKLVTPERLYEEDSKKDMPDLDF